MKTTIELDGHNIVIDVTEETVSVSAVKLGEEEEEVVEEFTLELVEGEGEDFEGDDDDIKGFGDFDEEEDFDELEGGEEGEDLEELDAEDFEEDETKLESYQDFINKK
jgi:hypothetical protein